VKVILLILFLIPIIIFQGALFLDIIKNINNSSKRHRNRDMYRSREARSGIKSYDNNRIRAAK